MKFVEYHVVYSSTNRKFDYDVAEIFLKVYDKSVYQLEWDHEVHTNHPLDINENKTKD